MNKLNFHISNYDASYGTPEQLPETSLPEVAFAGRSNVGKSSLLNKLMFSKKLAKVSARPGKTATINFYKVGKDTGWQEPSLEVAKGANEGNGPLEALGLEEDEDAQEIGPIHLVDLPGYGYAQVSKAEKERWSRLIGGYFDDDRDFALVVSLIDIRHDPTALDKSMVEFLQEGGYPFAIALTKADKLSKQKAAQQMSKIRKSLGIPKDVPIVVTSAESGTGIDDLRTLIAQACA